MVSRENENMHERDMQMTLCITRRCKLHIWLFRGGDRVEIHVVYA